MRTSYYCTGQTRTGSVLERSDRTDPKTPKAGELMQALIEEAGKLIS
jgi:hypothetical protein